MNTRNATLMIYVAVGAFLSSNAYAHANQEASTHDRASLDQAIRVAMHQSLRQFAEPFGDCSTSFDVVATGWFGASINAPWDPEQRRILKSAIDEAEVESRSSVAWTVVDKRLLLIECPAGQRDRVARTGQVDNQPACNTMLWNGQYWWTLRHEVTGNYDEVLVNPVPMYPNRLHAIPVFNGGMDWRSFAGTGSLLDMLQKLPVEEAADLGHVIKVSLALGEGGDARVKFVFERLGSQLRPIVVSFEVETTNRAGEEVVRTKMLIIDRWQEVDGVMIPEQAIYLEGQRLLDDHTGNIGESKAQIITRQTFVRVPSADELNVHLQPLESRTRVIDRRLGLSYRIGGTTLQMNNIAVTLSDPIDQFIVDDEMLQRVIEREKAKRQ